jgi:hypothetical protein
MAMKVGVRLDPRPDDLGAWLSTGAAFDAAGADALWVEVLPAPELDPLALTAALAAVTSRSLLVVAWPTGSGAALATIDRLSRGRLAILGDNASGAGTVHSVPGDPDVFVRDGERWVSVPLPDNRTSWQTTRREAAERGIAGLVVTADPRLLDLLRNPDDPGERRDLELAVG